MCGIFAYLGISPEAFLYVIAGLILLQNRGYDSSGICTIHDGILSVSKYASTPTEDSLEKLKKCKEKHMGSNIAMGHQRWATNGGKTDRNAHPHVSNNEKISVVHNGIIENYIKLKNMLSNNGFVFHSDTDTEVIPNLIQYHVSKGYSIIKAIEAATNDLEGTWGIVIMNADEPNKLYVSKNGSPLVIGFSDENVVVASEHTALQSLTSEYFALNNSDIIEIEYIVGGRFTFKNSLSTVGEPLSSFIKRYRRMHTESSIVELSPDPYKHWMLKEIFEQPKTILNAINRGGRIFDDSTVKLGGLTKLENVKHVKNLLIIGCGTSYNAGLLGCHYMRELEAFDTVQVIDAGEFTNKCIPKNSDVYMVVLSQSGETKDVHRAMEIAKEENVTIIGVVNVVDSLIARYSDCGVYLNAGREMAVASTKSFTSQVIVLSMIAVWKSQKEESLKEKRTRILSDLRRLSIDFEETLSLCGLCEKISMKISSAKDVFILGKGPSFPIALEGALKIKEVSYVHAEGYSSSSLKHGPYALIDEGTPIIVIVIDDENYSKNTSILEEIKSRHAYTIVITNTIVHESLYSDIIKIPCNKSYQSLLCVVPLQLIAYYASINKGINPDKPRNLAKVVTVD